MRPLTSHFTLEELTRSEWATRRGVDNTPFPEQIARLEQLCIHILEPLRTYKGKPITILSGYRNHQVNAAIGGAPDSQHQANDGAAADIVMPDLDPIDVVQAIVLLGLPFDQLIEELGTWCHVSYGPRNRREILRATRSSGGIVYTPLEVKF